MEHHRADAEAELEPEGDVEQDGEHRDADREEGVELDLLADGGAHVLVADLDEARGGVRLDERPHEHVGLALGRLDLELLSPSPDGALGGDVDVADVLGVGHPADARGVHLLAELHVITSPPEKSTPSMALPLNRTTTRPSTISIEEPMKAGFL